MASTPASGGSGPGPNFDPYSQTLTLMTATDGPIPIMVSDIDAFVFYAVRICINYASQTGASLILLVCLLLAAKPDKRTSSIFILNAAALLFNCIRTICQCVYFTGGFNEFYNYFSGDYSTVPPSQYRASITGIVFGLFVVICLEASLALQVRCLINSPTVKPLHRHTITVLSAIVALLAIGWRLALCITNAQAVMAAADHIDQVWIEKTSTYVTTASIVFFSAVFVIKLAFAIHRRRRNLDMKQFGPMEIIFVMGCQTLIVPAVFAILQNFNWVPELGSQLLTVTAIFLPLSSLWAAASVDNSKQKKDGARGTSGALSKLKSKRGYLGSFMSRNKQGSTADIETGCMGSLANNSSETTTARSSTLAGTPNNNTPNPNEKVKHDRVHSGSATSEFKINNSPMSAERSEKVKSLLADDEKEDTNGLRIYAGRSFDITEERVDESK